MGTLSVVATPIGNLGDLTLRALETLKSVDVIACEDTRVTAKLLARYEIKKPLVIFHARKARAGGARVLALLKTGKHIALVTDAGTPGISDPGAELVALVRRELSDVRIEVIPGASALVAALSIAGVPVAEFTFLGFLPHKKGRQTLFAEIAAAARTYVFYESPHRIEKALASLASALPDERRVVVARELTKMHESVTTGTATEVAAYFTNHPDEVRGEFVVIVASH
ncbi:MAG: 16S rRNA (cytidine(1402)-2'-O)-methyltransferase [Parcubacteria group bacterium 21-54-25]|nr:MAG: 16S rRNA (cytidine(1402)-2'-O)-methyltransferase [Parcubacteria group bacterium 21-54-25]HQU07468.1 16S rRNA (cytidine(1402)-2'-O)-methyltransferase [Candidatus Paceibacterota bacterium]